MVNSRPDLETGLEGARIMRTPRHLDLEITARCNLRCQYCYFFDNPAVEYRDLPTDDWLRFLEECGRCAVMDVTLAGGEPFARQDLPALIEGIVRNRMRFSILSNGTLIDRAMASFLSGTGRCNQVQVSVDGSGPETHDACRGKGSFEAAVHGIEALQAHSVPTTVRVTIHRHNVDDLERTARLLLEDLGLPEFSTNAAGYLGTCRHNASSVLLRTKDRQKAMETLLRLSSVYDGRISAQAGPLAEARRWRRMEDAKARGAEPFPDGGRLTGCGGPNTRIAVRADGAFVPCNMLAHLELGRINRDPLVEVWRDSPILNQMRRRHTISLDRFPVCADCEYRPYCTGNCPALAYTLTRHIDHPSPDACLRRFLADGGMIPEDVAHPIASTSGTGTEVVG